MQILQWSFEKIDKEGLINRLKCRNRGFYIKAGSQLLSWSPQLHERDLGTPTLTCHLVKLMFPLSVAFLLTCKWIRTERFRSAWVYATEKCVLQLKKESRGCSSVAEHLRGINEAWGSLDPRTAKQNKSITVACVKPWIQSPALKEKLRGVGHWRDGLMVNCSDILCVI